MWFILFPIRSCLLFVPLVVFSCCSAFRFAEALVFRFCFPFPFSLFSLLRLELIRIDWPFAASRSDGHNPISQPNRRSASHSPTAAFHSRNTQPDVRPVSTRRPSAASQPATHPAMSKAQRYKQQIKGERQQRQRQQRLADGPQTASCNCSGGRAEQSESNRIDRLATPTSAAAAAVHSHPGCSSGRSGRRLGGWRRPAV